MRRFGPGALFTACAAAALLLAATSARADDRTFEACRSKAISTVDIEACQKGELAAVEPKLNAAYAKALSALPADQRAKLVEAERRWVAFREADCEAFYGEHAGTIAGIAAGDCLIRHAKDRIRDLGTFSED